MSRTQGPGRSTQGVANRAKSNLIEDPNSGSFNLKATRKQPGLDYASLYQIAVIDENPSLTSKTEYLRNKA